MNNLFKIFIAFVLICTFIILIFNDEVLLVLMPMSYIVGKFTISFIDNPNIKFTKYVYDTLGVMRLIIIPMLIVLSEDKIIDNLPLGREDFNQAVILVSIEYVIGTTFLYLFSRLFSNKTKNRDGQYYISGSTVIYILFIISSVGLFLWLQGARESVSFLVIPTHNSGRGTEEVGSAVVLVRMLLQLALALSFIIASYLGYKKYRVNPKLKYLLIPLAFGLINISLIVGERRSLQLYTLVSVLVIVSILFKYHRRKINTLMVLVGASILVLMTLYKELYIFNFSSYSAALEASSASDIKFIDQIQSYFYGPSNVASAIDYLNYYPGNFKQFLFDNARAIFGLNLFINHDHLITSQLFNQLIYGKEQLTGHLISSAGYGYIYFGPFLFYIVLAFNLFIACTFEWILHRAKSLELIFIGTFIYMRIATSMFGHTIPIITLITSTITIYMVVIIISMIFKRAINNGGFR